jgi:hypothetical protein
MGKEVCCTPQQSDPGRVLLRSRELDELSEAIRGLAHGRSFGGEITVVEAVVGGAELGDQFERGVQAVARRLHRIRVLVPRHRPRCRAERILPPSDEAVPVGDREPQVVAERTSADDEVFVIEREGQRVARPGPLELDPGYGRKVLAISDHHVAHAAVSSIRLSDRAR